MATIGLRNLYKARITIGNDGTETYGVPTRLAKAISAEMSIETAEESLYADDGVDAVAKEFVSGEIKLGVNDLLPEDLAELLGQTQDSDDVIYASGDDEAPYFAIGFQAKKADGQYKYIWLYKVKFAVPEESYKTKGKEIEFSTPEITGTFFARPDGKWKAEHVGGGEGDTVAAGWFTEVREPATA